MNGTQRDGTQRDGTQRDMESTFSGAFNLTCLVRMYELVHDEVGGYMVPCACGVMLWADSPPELAKKVRHHLVTTETTEWL